MSETIIPPGYAQVAVQTRHTTYARPSTNVFGVEILDVDKDPQEIAEEIRAVWTTSFGPLLDSSCSTTSVRVAIGQDGGPPTIGEWAGSVANSRAINSLPPAMAVRLRWNSALGGRRGRGSMFLCWAASESEVSETGNISAGELATIQSRQGTFRVGIGTAGYPLVILHSVGVSVPPDPTPVVSGSPDPIISNQVRRQLRR